MNRDQQGDPFEFAPIALAEIDRNGDIVRPNLQFRSGYPELPVGSSALSGSKSFSVICH